LDRAAINIASITLGISFLSSLLLTDYFYSIYALEEGALLSVETYQYWLVFVAFVVCVVSIVNSMLISVYERFREIGTMKCLGALDKHILMLFLVEAIIEGVAGGIMGFFVGFFAAIFSLGFSKGFNIIMKTSAIQLLGIFAISSLLSTILCVAATLYPAYKAARLTPVEAIRYEL
jgi:ABC-type antimicrobial peptide transport system permease subunit